MSETTHRVLMPMFEELRGERVIVRPYRLADGEALFEAVAESREHLRTYMPWERFHQTMDDSRDFIVHSQAKWLLREDMTVGVFEAASGRFLGGSGLHVRDWDVPYFEIGYWLRKSAEGHGYMAETVRLLADYAFMELKANRVEIRCDARNVRSAAVAQRLGFVAEGRRRNDALGADGSVRDTLLFSLTPSDPRWP